MSGPTYLPKFFSNSSLFQTNEILNLLTNNLFLNGVQRRGAWQE